jgi:hypothetical protein
MAQFALSGALLAGSPGSVAPARSGYGPRKPYQALVTSALFTSLRPSETWACLSPQIDTTESREPSAPTPTIGSRNSSGFTWKSLSASCPALATWASRSRESGNVARGLSISLAAA